jgi:hypothetical protein
MKTFLLILGDMHEYANIQELIDDGGESGWSAKYEVRICLPAEGYTLEETARNFLWGLASGDGWLKDGSLSYFFQEVEKCDVDPDAIPDILPPRDAPWPDLECWKEEE